MTFFVLYCIIFKKTVFDFLGMRKDLIKRYGIILPRPDHLTARTLKITPGLLADGVSVRHTELICALGNKEASFEIKIIEPTSRETVSTVILLSPASEVPNRYLPADAAFRKGVRVIQICTENVLASARRQGALRSLFSGRRSVCGTSLLAFAVMRAAEYAASLERCDISKIAAMAHGAFCEAALLGAVGSNVITHAALSCPLCEFDGSLYTSPKEGLTHDEQTDLFIALLDECEKKIMISITRYENEKLEAYTRASLNLRAGYPTPSSEDWAFFMEKLSES